MSIAAVAILAACTNNSAQKATGVDESANEDTTAGAVQALGVIEFESSAFDFGTVKEGVVVDHAFKFKNTGKAPVILAQVSASCGCTTPSYTKEPILPGKEGEVKVSFDSHGQVGVQQKIITISSNAENNVTTIQLKGTVEK